MVEKSGGQPVPANVKCCVKDCVYHTRTDLCRAQTVTVSNENARRKAETFCATFENREKC